MRDFFIKSYEMIVNVIVVLLSLAVIVVAIGTMFNSMPGQPGGVLPGLLVLVVGIVYVLFVGGLLYLGLGIYQNTRRTAEAAEKMTAKP